MTAAQRNALASLAPHYLINPAAQEPLLAQFAQPGPLHAEIGFGNGEALIEIALRHPLDNYLGIEVHRPGVGNLLRLIDNHQVNNIRIAVTDAVSLLEERLEDASLASVNLFFPDPWPKKRHHKRRIVQPKFIQLVARKLSSGGRFHLATDWEPYAKHMLSTLEASEQFTNLAGAGNFHPRPSERPLTKFEQRGRRLGHQSWDLIYQKRMVEAAK